jgi:YidC/Oxa1 family membrane protein insertase
MDKNSVIGLLLIAGIMIGYSWFTQPNESEKIAYQKQLDSIAKVEENKKLLDIATKKDSINSIASVADDAAADTNLLKKVSAERQEKFGVFAANSAGVEKEYTIENEKIKVFLSSKGGYIKTVQLKQYTAYDSLPVYIYDGKTSKFGFDFKYKNKGMMNTSNLFFETADNNFSVANNEKKQFKFTANAGDGKAIEYIYTLAGNGFQVDMNVNFKGLENEIDLADNTFKLNWTATGLNNEKNVVTERSNSSIFYKPQSNTRDYLSESGDDDDIIDDDKLTWVAYKQNFFSAILKSGTGFEKNSSLAVVEATDSAYTKRFVSNLNLTAPSANNYSLPLNFYFVHNQYDQLKVYGDDMEKIINYGWGIFGWINIYFLKPIFEFLLGINMNIGIIILLLTVAIKIVIFPLNYKNYVSSAKMKVLKPEMDELNEKHKNSDPIKKQQATMELYRKTGVNPFAGCIPLLIQMPILYAAFRFFPAAIELRHKPFLWADDLSSYDSILNLGFNIPAYGSHVSLFTLLMAASTFIYTMTNSSNMPQQTQPGMPNMKVIMYIFPFMMLFFFNGFSAGLSYYYFLSNIFSILMMYLIKKFFVDEEKIRLKIVENKSKPGAGKKSAFQTKLEEMAKQRGVKLKP